MLILLPPSEGKSEPRRGRPLTLGTGPLADARRDVLAITEFVAKRLEYYVGNHPEQWTVFQRRWARVRSGRR